MRILKWTDPMKPARYQTYCLPYHAVGRHLHVTLFPLVIAVIVKCPSASVQLQ